MGNPCRDSNQFEHSPVAIRPNHQPPFFAVVLEFDEANRVGPGLVKVESSTTHADAAGSVRCGARIYRGPRGPLVKAGEPKSAGRDSRLRHLFERGLS